MSFGALFCKMCQIFHVHINIELKEKVRYFQYYQLQHNIITKPTCTILSATKDVEFCADVDHIDCVWCYVLNFLDNCLSLPGSRGCYRCRDVFTAYGYVAINFFCNTGSYIAIWNLQMWSFWFSHWSALHIQRTSDCLWSVSGLREQECQIFLHQWLSVCQYRHVCCGDPCWYWSTSQSCVGSTLCHWRFLWSGCINNHYSLPFHTDNTLYT